ncbi:hypothetical protein FISHEDRAFT_12871, partial [Fistulina hepatica ATCC 64428]
KAFGIATLAVMSSAVAFMWGIKVYTGVRDTQEFGDRLRQKLAAYMPDLYAQIH